jgi:hypothetical protein
MNLFTKRFGLVLAGVVGVGAVASLATGASLALFSANASPGQPNSFAAGTVTLGTSSTGYVTCNETNMAPGDSSAGYVGASVTTTGNRIDPTCDSSANYTGSLNAYIGVEISFTATSAPGGYALINDNDPNASSQEFKVNGKDPWSGAWTSTDSSLTVNCGTDTSTSVQTCTGNTEIFVVGAAGPSPNPSGIANLEEYFNDGGGTKGSVAANLDYYLPLAATNGYQGASATVTITFYSVQCSNNAFGLPAAVNADCSAANAPAAWS